MILSCDWGTSTFRLRLVDNPNAAFPSAGFPLVDEPSLGFPSVDNASLGLPSVDNASLGFPSVDKPSTGSAPPATNPSLHHPTGIAAAFADWQRSGLPETQRVHFYRAILQRAIDELQQQLRHEPQGRSDQALRGLPVVVSGMASSSIGMLELPYHPLPFSTTGADLTPAILPATPDLPHPIILVPGIRSENDLMRGEETQLIGCDVDPDEAGFFIFPGTHSKHIRVLCGQAVDFNTFMTGEFFALLTRHSILAASVENGGHSNDSGGSRGPAFLAGVDAAQQSGLLNSAFSVRTRQLLAKWSETDNYQYLSGLLIGEELKGLTARSPTGQPPNKQPLTLVAAEPLLGSYRAALSRLGFTDVKVVNADQALVQGHRRLFERHAGRLKKP